MSLLSAMKNQVYRSTYTKFISDLTIEVLVEAK